MVSRAWGTRRARQRPCSPPPIYCGAGLRGYLNGAGESAIYSLCLPSANSGAKACRARFQRRNFRQCCQPAGCSVPGTRRLPRSASYWPVGRSCFRIPSWAQIRNPRNDWHERKGWSLTARDARIFQTGRASTTATADAVGVTLLSRKPACSNSAAYSSSVRSSPPVYTSMIMSAALPSPA